MSPTKTPVPAKDVTCADLDAAIERYTTQQGYRLDMIMPADAPRIALLSKGDSTIRLIRGRGSSALTNHDPGGLLVESANADDSARAWVGGRAGMQYRDLIPSRLGGRCIASHIRIPIGGPVSDYVHYHQIEFQMIYCRRGWVRAVYEDQGPPFVMNPGDCVLQPPTIRHRVLEASDGLEVIEIALPAEHETWRDHQLTLPNASRDPERRFAGQRFVRHIAAKASWHAAEWPGFDCRDTGIGEATDGHFDVRVVRANAATGADAPSVSNALGGRFSILCVLSGQAILTSPSHGLHRLFEGDTCVIQSDCAIALASPTACELLQMTAI